MDNKSNDDGVRIENAQRIRDWMERRRRTGTPGFPDSLLEKAIRDFERNQTELRKERPREFRKGLWTGALVMALIALALHYIVS